MLNELTFESLIQMSSLLSVLACIRPRHIHFAMSWHASYCCILFGDVCVSLSFATGSVPEEYRDYPNEEPYQCIEPSGKQPTI